MPDTEDSLSEDERARRQLRWANRKRKLTGLPPLLDKRKANLRAKRKKRLRRARGSGMRRRVKRGDGRLKWVRDLKAAGRWVPRDEYRARLAAEEFDRLLDKWGFGEEENP
jgi:hypothetical protein